MLDKHQLWITSDNEVLCIDHIVFTDAFNGRRLTPADYADQIMETGTTFQCHQCERNDDDHQEGFGNVYLLFGKNNANGLHRSRANHPAGRKIAPGTREKK